MSSYRNITEEKKKESEQHFFAGTTAFLLSDFLHFSATLSVLKMVLDRTLFTLFHRRTVEFLTTVQQQQKFPLSHDKTFPYSNSNVFSEGASLFL